MNPIKTLTLVLLLAAAGGAANTSGAAADECGKLRAAIDDLRETFPNRYEKADEYLDRLARIEAAVRDGKPSAVRDLEQLRREALLANPLLRELPGLLVVKRQPRSGKAALTDLQQQIGHSAGPGLEIGMPSNHECNASLDRLGYDNEISRLSPVSPEGTLTTIYRPEHGGYVGELDLHYDADRLLFTQSDETSWKLWELGTDGGRLRQVTRLPDDVHAMDGCYLPDGRIVMGTTASYQSVPCWHGRKLVSTLYLMDADGTHVRQLCFDQDHDWNPTVLPTGQVLYQRWDYTGINHIYLRQLMTMNPDGTKQRAVYGSNSWFPNALFFPRAIPGTENRLLCILSGYHGPHRMGQLVVVDPTRGSQEERGIVQRISGRGQAVEPKVIDVLGGADWPKFLHPWPLSDKYFLVSGREDARSPWRIYLADGFDNIVVVHESPGYALLEPTPLKARPRPPVIPDQVDLSATEATVFVSDVHEGPGLAGVPRGTIKSLRVLAYHLYDALIHSIRRPGIEDDVSMLRPGEYHADTSELVQLLQKGHHGVRLDAEAWDRIVTWIDLNGPCHGTWGDVFPVPDGVHQRRMELRAKFGGPADDPERVVETAIRMPAHANRVRMVRPEPLAADGWPMSGPAAAAAQRTHGGTRCEIALAQGVVLPFVRVPAGRFVMGDVRGEPDEFPQRLVEIDAPFWMGAHEVSNALYRLFDPAHDSGYYSKRRDRPDGKGLSLNDNRQPALRVSRDQALAFCEWLSERVGTRVTLPSEAQWEYACRAGTASTLSYGSVDDDFSAWGNMADRLFSTGLEDAKGGMMPEGGVTQVSGGVPHLLLEGAELADRRFDDGFRVTAPTGSFRPNRWGLHDMHGNAAEWTLGTHRESGECYVRGGSFAERPERCRSSFRLRYPEWQRVYNVGFRVVCGKKPLGRREQK